LSLADLILALRAAHLPMPRYLSSPVPAHQDWLLRWLSQAPDRGDAT
jgi:hypothetical protein